MFSSWDLCFSGLLSLDPFLFPMMVPKHSANWRVNTNHAITIRGWSSKQLNTHVIRLIHGINHVKVLEGKGHFHEGSQGNKGFTAFKDAFLVCCLYNADVCVFVTAFFLKCCHTWGNDAYTLSWNKHYDFQQNYYRSNLNFYFTVGIIKLF